MPLEYTVSDDGKFVHATAKGMLAPEDIRRYVHELIEDDRVRVGYRELFDASGTTGSLVTLESIQGFRRLNQGNPKKLPGSKLAIVVSRSSSFEKARHFERLVEPDAQNVIVFNSSDVAKIWLGVELPSRSRGGGAKPGIVSCLGIESPPLPTIPRNR
jgi:hypothetical protein